MRPPDHVEQGEDEEQEEPEPEGDVDLVIDHVYRKNTKTIKPSKFEKWITVCAFRIYF